MNASVAVFNCIMHSYGRIAKTWLMLCQFVYAAVMQFGGFTLRYSKMKRLRACSRDSLHCCKVCIV